VREKRKGLGGNVGWKRPSFWGGGFFKDVSAKGRAGNEARSWTQCALQSEKEISEVSWVDLTKASFRLASPDRNEKRTRAHDLGAKGTLVNRP